MWKKPILHYQQFMEKPYVTIFIQVTIHITYLPSKYLQCVLQNSEPTLNLKNILTIDLFQVQENKHIFMFFFCLKETAWCGSNFLTSVSAFYADTRLHKNKGTRWFLG